MKTTHCLLLVPLATLACACSSDDKVNIGDRPIGTLGEKLSDYAGNWDGYAEAYQFSSGSDRVRLTLNATGNGTLEIGDAPALPPATDPNVGYPPGMWGATGASSELLEGLLYPVHDTHLEAKRLRLGAAGGDLWVDWCAMQTPIADTVNPGRYACVANTGFSGDASGNCYVTNPDGTQGPQVDCGKLGLCSMGAGCECTASACVANSGVTVQLDGALEADGNDLIGTLTVGGRVTVRLTRQ